MNEIYERYTGDGVRSVFLYTQEAHPGEHWPHLTSMEQKFRHAEALRDELGVSRPILVDSLEGDCHWAYGSMPNMTWIVSGSGMPVYKSDWTDANSVANALEYFVGVLNRRKSGEKMASFNVERLDYRKSDQEAFFKGLEFAGPKAVEEFRRVFRG